MLTQKAAASSWGTEGMASRRLLAAESSNRSYKRVPVTLTSFTWLKTWPFQRFSFNLDDQRYFNQLTPFEDGHGITWFIGMSS
ncbi:hypothetical protein O9993_04575 [Vibrio lentus]|nr:hypothetical protein [Vibrio lentus]